MKRLLAAFLLVASTALGQSNGWQEIQNGWGEIQTPPGYSTIPAPTGCASGLVPYFDASLKLVCSPTVYAPATDTTTSTGTIAARNFTATALATPTVTSVTPVLTKVGSITTVAGASLVDGDYFTIKYAPGLTVPIEFDATPGNGTTGGRVPYVFAPGDTADQIRDGLITLLNSAAGTALTASSGGAATVSLVLDTPGAAGDTNTENVANAGFAVTGFVNPTAATTYGYKVVSYLADVVNGTAASTEVTTAAGHATLSASNFNTVVFAPSPGSTSTRLYRTTGGAAPPKLLYTGTATSYVDTGAAGTAQTPATSNTTGRVLVGDGSAAAPSLAFVNGSGIYRGASTGGIIFAPAGYGRVKVGANGATALMLETSSSFSWASGGEVADTGGNDLFLSRAAAATLQLGAANAAAPVGQRLRSQGAVTSADIAGADLNISAGNMTGTGLTTAAGRTSTLNLQSYRPLTTGTTASTLLDDRVTVPGLWTTLTAASADGFATITFPASAAVGAEFLVLIEANDGTEYQSLTSRVRVSSVRKAAGNTVSTVSLIGTDLLSASSGTLTSTFTVVEGAAAVTVAANAASSLAETTLRLSFQSVANGPATIAQIP